MRVLVAGGTGFVGTHLIAMLTECGHEVTLLTRQKHFNSHCHQLQWDGCHLDLSERYDAVVNLCGANIATRRWSEARKAILLSSRVDATKALVAYCQQFSTPPKLLQASAIGFYPSTCRIDSETDTIDSGRLGYAHDLVSAWETAAFIAERVTVFRIGVVMGHGGFLKTQALPLAFHAGVTFGRADAMCSWIHIHDLCALFVAALESKTDWPRIINATAPDACSWREFFNAVSETRRLLLRPTLPAAAVKMVFGELGEQLLLADQVIKPAALLKMGFEFKFSNIQQALKGLLPLKLFA